MDLAIDCWRFNDQRIDAYIVGTGRKRIYAVNILHRKVPWNVMFTGLGIQPLKVALIMNGSHSESRPLRRKRRKARSPGLKGITLISSLLIAG
jgi:hypothetical protein